MSDATPYIGRAMKRVEDPRLIQGLGTYTDDLRLAGLLHACMAIYYAYIDRAPVLILGATGPMNEAKRRPRIDWIHTPLDARCRARQPSPI